jgi:hypothetical protein
VVPTGVFAASEDFGDRGLDELADPTPFEDLLRGA